MADRIYDIQGKRYIIGADLTPQELRDHLRSQGVLGPTEDLPQPSSGRARRQQSINPPLTPEREIQDEEERIRRLDEEIQRRTQRVGPMVDDATRRAGALEGQPGRTIGPLPRLGEQPTTTLPDIPLALRGGRVDPGLERFRERMRLRKGGGLIQPIAQPPPELTPGVESSQSLQSPPRSLLAVAGQAAPSIAGQMAGRAVGTVLAGPPGAVVGEALGGAAGEALAQLSGLNDPSLTQIAAAALAGPLSRVALKAIKAFIALAPGVDQAVREQALVKLRGMLSALHEPSSRLQALYARAEGLATQAGSISVPDLQSALQQLSTTEGLARIKDPLIRRALRGFADVSQSGQIGLSDLIVNLKRLGTLQGQAEGEALGALKLLRRAAERDLDNAPATAAVHALRQAQGVARKIAGVRELGELVERAAGTRAGAGEVESVNPGRLLDLIRDEETRRNLVRSLGEKTIGEIERFLGQANKVRSISGGVFGVPGRVVSGIAGGGAALQTGMDPITSTAIGLGIATALQTPVGRAGITGILTNRQRFGPHVLAAMLQAGRVVLSEPARK